MTRSKELRNVGPEIDALRLGMDWHSSDLDRYQILIESTQGSSHPGSFALDQLVEAIEIGIRYGQGKPAKFTVTDICDGIAQGHEGMNYSLVSREIMAAMVEIHARANPIDGLVLVSACDKAVPAHLMAAARLNIPVIHVPGGVMSSGPGGLTLEQIGTYHVKQQRGEITTEEFAQLKANACPSCGACQFMGTAGTMQVMAEALGLALPGSAVAPFSLKTIKNLARGAGKQIISLIEKGITSKEILTFEAFYNAIVIHAAISGSTNALLHLPAIAREAGVEIKPQLFDEINRKVPCLVNTRPTGKYATEYFWYAGGVPALMLKLKDFLYLDVMTCTGKTLRVNLESLEKGLTSNNGYLDKYGIRPEEIILPLEKPISEKGSIAILQGNLAQEGAVVKYAAVAPQMCVHIGPAKVFNNELKARQAILQGKISPGDIIVINYAGPKGSGMPEMFYTTEALAASPQLIATTAIITDGRFSGATRGPAIGHISPEAAEGGTIAFVEDDDLIEIDIPNRKLNIVGINNSYKTPQEIDEVIALRKSKGVKINLNGPKGVLGLYQRLATSAMTGGYMK